jgi:hypothetical protein
MYYPSRIRQLIDQDDMESAAEVVDYYRELYNLLSLQAMTQVERVKLHLRPVTLYGQTVLGDENLLRYLFQLLSGEKGKKKGAGDRIESSIVNDQYVRYSATLSAPLSPLSAYIIRQIIRDHGEATNRRGCSLHIDNNNETTIINITLPAYGKLQSNHS